MSEPAMSARPASREQRMAAVQLGGFYLALAHHGELPLGIWAHPDGPQRYRRAQALDFVHGSDFDRKRDEDLHGIRYVDKYTLHDQAHRAVVEPDLQNHAFGFALRLLGANDKALEGLKKELRAPGVSGWLHQTASAVGRAPGGLEPTREEVFGAVADERGTKTYTTDHDLLEAQKKAKLAAKERIGAALGEELEAQTPKTPPLDPREERARHRRADLEGLLGLLFAVPEGVEILAAYARSAEEGTALALSTVDGAMSEVAEFRERLAEAPHHVWRYAPLVVGGTAAMKLADVPGFVEYAVDMGGVLGRDWYETPLEVAGLIILGVGLAFALPATGGAAAGVVLAVGATDLAFSGLGTWLTFQREREREAAARGSAFLTDGRKIAESRGYPETFLSSAGTLLTGLAFRSDRKRWVLGRVPRPPEKLPVSGGAPTPIRNPTRSQDAVPPAGPPARGGPQQAARGTADRGTGVATAAPNSEATALGPVTTASAGHGTDGPARRGLENRLAGSLPKPPLDPNEVNLGPWEGPSGLELDLSPRPERPVPLREMDPADIPDAAASNSFGAPSAERGGTFERRGLHYHELNAAEVAHGVRVDYDRVAGRPRSVRFRVDSDVADRVTQSGRGFAKDVSTEGAQPSKEGYAKSGWDQGHLVQREAVRGDKAAERAVDQYTMVVPMHPELNRGRGSPWRASERRAIELARRHGSVTVRVEPIYDANPPALSDGTPIPRAFRRTILAPDGRVLEDLSFINH